MRLGIGKLHWGVAEEAFPCAECGRPIRAQAQILVQRRSRIVRAHKACGSRWLKEQSEKMLKLANNVCENSEES